ncbi:hypothetical protein DRJ24_03405 [Candidatus Acetothermia bacterium]|mgnify:CR=1 FL=1|nr:MAG: hypothetical protein DRJ24_03405 [Candidatus Acetothermia bacterium]
MTQLADPKLIGAAVGILAGILLLAGGWRAFLILLGFGVAGYIAGSLFESRREIAIRMKDAIARLFRP